MSQPASKRSRLCSSPDQGYTCLASSEISEDSKNSSARDAQSYIYKAVNYVTMLETKDCYMRRSPDGPMPEDIALCRHLLSQPIKPPNGTLFDDKYNDQWSKAQPIYGPRPQPDHARGLKWSAFTEAHRHKLSIMSDEKLLSIPREDMFFPYLTAEIQSENQALEFADRQNMHNMCIAGRAVVSLCQAAGCLEMVHRRILGFSISHSLKEFRIYGYYPEVDNGKVSFYRWPISQPSIWTLEDRWTCYQFVENVDREFLPIHTNRLMDLLEKVPDPDVFGVDLQLSIIGSQGHHISTQNHGLQPELQKMIEVLQQQLAEQKTREEKREAEQKAREERLIAQLELQGRLIAGLGLKNESK
ncbi:hypothetical protein N7488_004424 [Penicillium malachiteum]|nr:hypothetical protein N7488_004424 [Penicillium malachiteum]